MNDALEFLKRAAAENCRIVSSGDLTYHQIVEARACNRFYVEPGGGLGWALLPWDLTTEKDRHRESKYFASLATGRRATTTEGSCCKGGQNPENTSNERPPAPSGSGA